MSGSKETLLLEPEKSAPRIETLEPEKVDEEEEGKKDESSCSSEEEEDEDSESETEAGASAALVSQCQWGGGCFALIKSIFYFYLQTRASPRHQ